MASKYPGGRPPKYKTKEEIEEKIEAYFAECEGELLTDDAGNPLLTKYGGPIYLNRRPPTVTGLALALGFATRVSLLQYQGKAEFRDTILRAKSKIEMYTEERLFDKDGSAGAKFSLQNNFKGWDADKKQPEDKAPAINIICDVPRTADTQPTPTIDDGNEDIKPDE